MTVRVYKSTDVGAPTIGRTAGALITLLDACLVNGYGAKAGAGWTKPFTGTNQAVFKQGAGSSQRYLYVNDSISVDYAAIAGACTVTSISSVLEQFPTTARYMDKPDAGWMLVANEKFFFLLTHRTLWGGLPADMSFGDLVSVGGANDLGRCFLQAAPTYAAAVSYYPPYCGMPQGNAPEFCGDSGGYFPTFPGLSVRWFPSNIALAINNQFGGGPLFAPIGVTIAANKVHQDVDYRGTHPCLYAFFETVAEKLPYQSGDIIDGTGAYAGKQFMYLIQCNNGNSYRYPYLVEISDTWGN
jgi:hypothetical protein